MHRHELADAARGGGSGIGRGLHSSDIAPNHHGDVPGADVFLADQRDIGGLDHRIGSFDRSDQSFCLYQSQRFLPDGLSLIPLLSLSQHYSQLA